MTATQSSSDLGESVRRPSSRWRTPPYAVAAAGGIVIGCVSLAALILAPSPGAALPILAALAVVVAMILVAVVAISRSRVESALLHTEATLRHLQETTSEIRLERPDARSPIRDPDSLLFSKEFFDELLDREMGRATREKFPLTVLMIQVAWPEPVPDSVVSAFLRAAATALRRRVRSFDCICRYERQVLAVLMPGLSERQAEGRAEELLAMVKETRVADLPRVSDGELQASAGVATHRPDDGPAASQSLLRRAFLALYESRVGQPKALERYESRPDHEPS
ncbi:MAG: diguanylate cyclase [Bacteroidales bacterium]